MLGHSGSGTNSKYVHAEMERIRAKLDVGQEDIDLPTNDEQLRREYDSLECIPDELDEIMCAWREKRDINKLSQTEKRNYRDDLCSKSKVSLLRIEILHQYR